jgi:hypothetical protein
MVVAAEMGTVETVVVVIKLVAHVVVVTLVVDVVVVTLMAVILARLAH